MSNEWPRKMWTWGKDGIWVATNVTPGPTDDVLPVLVYPETAAPEIASLRSERDTLRELVREQLDDGRTSWLEWKERAEKALGKK
jgi:hypothetical protein